MSRPDFDPYLLCNSILDGKIE
ncbi:hypothetical protein FRAHR75_50053 [Frankia sp. Hr75.2]|nr:hypothetical protein FRAHR75_50053 [Frankia sp. Hr75.2]